MTIGRVPHDELRRARKFSSGGLERKLGPWYETADRLDIFRVSSLLLDVCSGAWVDGIWVRDVFDCNDFHLQVRPNLIVTIRLARDYPDAVQLIYIGPQEEG
jgi:hypothetical protein